MKLRFKKGHWRQIDFRYRPLASTIEGLKGTIAELREFTEQSVWYDVSYLKEDIEPIYWLAFIAFQNYINSSIFDLDDHLSNKLELYSFDEEIDKGVTRIQLIIAVANYFKHRDDSRELHKGTSSILDKLGLQFGEDDEIDTSPIFASMELLGSPNWDLDQLVKLVKKWRDKIWTELVTEQE